jgi:formate C-acetyltransferase
MQYDFLSRIEAVTPRVSKLTDMMLSAVPSIESERAQLITQSYMETENMPAIMRRALALDKILQNMPAVIHDGELIVGNFTKKVRSAQIFPEYSNKWLLDEFDTLNERTGDLFTITDKVKDELRETFKYWDGKTVNELATSYMSPETLQAMEHNVFTVNNYYFNGIGHVSVDYAKVLRMGFNGIILEADKNLKALDVSDSDYAQRREFLQAVIISSNAVISFAKRFSDLAAQMAAQESDAKRRAELQTISRVCAHVPANPAGSYYEACQTFWFIHEVLQIESNGHSVSPMRFDQYMYPYFKADMDSGRLSYEFAQELTDCVILKLNEVNKVRDSASTKAFGGYPMFQNMIVGGQTVDGEDATNELSFICLEAVKHTRLAQPSISVRVWQGTPDELLLKAADVTAIGTGMPAYYNDDVVIPALLNRGVSLKDARDYGVIGCVEPQKGGKTDGWHDSGFFNLGKLLEITLHNGKEGGVQVGPQTGEFTSFTSIGQLIEAYRRQMEYFVKLLVNADNCVDIAHAQRAPLPFLSSMVDDCIKRGRSVMEGGAHYNFTGPQGVGVANVGDSFEAVDKLVYKEKVISAKDLLAALDDNFGPDAMYDEAWITMNVYNALYKQGAISKEKMAQLNNFYTGKYNKGEYIRQILLNRAPKYGNDIDEVDMYAKEAALIYCREVEKYKNPRGGTFQPGLYPASINVAMGAVTGATPDGRKAGTPLADGVSPSAGADKLGPTAVMNSVAKLDHTIASNGTLLNQKFHPSVLKGENGYKNLANLIRGYFRHLGMHVQFNVVSRKTLLDAQAHPERYKSLVVRVAGYSAQFISLDKSIQDDIINRTEQEAV